MYLSKLSLDIAHPSARQSLFDANDMHRNLYSAYGEGLLYRVFIKKQAVQIVVLSKNEPYVAELANHGYILLNYVNMSSLPSLYRDGCTLNFNILTHPSIKVSQKKYGKKNSSRCFINDANRRKEWLVRQGDKSGFKVLYVYEPSSVKKVNVRRKTGEFSVPMVEFSGIVQITDADLFWSTWEKGIGPEKAYGSGLMLLSNNKHPL